MVIRKMNSMFSRHGRTMFAIITLAVIVSFLGFLTPGFTSLFSQGGRDMVFGTVFGRKITHDEFRNQNGRNMIILSLIYGGIPLGNPQLDEMARQETFPALCRIEAANQRGIKVTDQQIADFIAKLPVFQGKESKQFDIAIFQKYLDNILKPGGFSPLDLDESVRSFLLQQALEQEIEESVIVTPGEIKAYYNQFNEKFDVWIGRFKAEDFLAGLTVSEKEMKDYFDINRKKFIMPAKFQASVVAFDYNNYAAEAAAQVSAAAVQKFYDDNKRIFTQPAADDKQEPKVLPFEQVKEKAKKMLDDKIRTDIALKNAQIFARDVYEKVSETEKTSQYQIFNTFVEKSKLKPVKADWFSAEDLALGEIKEPELVKQIAQIYENVPVSNAVAGRKAAYVAFLTNKQASRQKEFDEARRDVLSEIKKVKAQNLATEAARNTALNLSQAKAAERVKSVKGVSAPKFEKMDSFIVMDPPYGPEGARIARIVENLPVNGVSPTIPTEYGAFIIFVEKRTLPDPAEFEKQQKYIEYVYHQKKAGAARAAFTSWLLSKCQSQGI
jgi:hypothetical protein